MDVRPSDLYAPQGNANGEPNSSLKDEISHSGKDEDRIRVRFNDLDVSCSSSLPNVLLEFAIEGDG